MGFEIKSTHPNYDQVYAAWALNNYSGQFDTLITDDDEDVVGGALFRVLVIDGETKFYQVASMKETPIPDTNADIDPGWGFIGDKNKGMYEIPKPTGLPGLAADHPPNELR